MGLKVYIDGMYSFTRVRNNNDLRHYGAGVTVETLTDEWGFDRDQIWIIAQPLKVIVETKKKRTSYLFGPPYVTDLASVPKFLRSAVDNDDIRLIAPALVHDYHFATHAKTFKEANKLFRQMIRGVGGGRFKAFICWLAVSSSAAKRCYKDKSYEMSEFIKGACEVTVGKPRT